MAQNCPECGRFRRWTKKGWKCPLPHSRIAHQVKKLNRLQREALRLFDEGLSKADVARRIGVDRQTVNRWARL